MMKMHMVFMLTIMIAVPAVGEEYMPLETGNYWSYVADDGAREMRVVAGQTPIFQGTPYAVEHPISAVNQGLVNFWTTEPDGDVLLWGYSRSTWGYLYQPPILMVDAPLTVGKSWTVTVDLYSLPDTLFTQTADLTFTVHEAPELTVPAGVFSTFGIGPDDPAAKTLFNGGYTLSGELKSDKSAGPGSWYSAGVGIVQDDTDRLYKLESYTDHPVGIELSSWGRVKALYRRAD